MVSHCSDVIMSAMSSQITGISVFHSTVCSGADQRKHQSSASLAFVRGIHRWAVNYPHNESVTRKCFHLIMSSCQIIDNATTCLNSLFRLIRQKRSKLRIVKGIDPWPIMQEEFPHTDVTSLLRLYYVYVENIPMEWTDLFTIWLRVWVMLEKYLVLINSRSRNFAVISCLFAPILA